MPNDLTVRESGALAQELSVDDVMAQVVKVQQLMQRAMRQDEHFGIIPGTKKPTLLKAGAEKLCFMFRLAPSYTHIRTMERLHLTVESTCTLTHIASQLVYGAGSGVCSTREQKYAWRTAARKCPKCQKKNIRKSKDKDEWYCWRKTDGCGATFKLNDPQITDQVEGRIENEDLADTWNTVTKMADKRALVAAALNATAASDIFTQDMEDLQADAAQHAQPVTQEEPAKAQGSPKSHDSKKSTQEPIETTATRQDEAYDPKLDGGWYTEPETKPGTEEKGNFDHEAADLAIMIEQTKFPGGLARVLGMYGGLKSLSEMPANTRVGFKKILEKRAALLKDGSIKA